METLAEVKNRYIAKALTKPIAAYGIQINGQYQALSSHQTVFADNCPVEVTAEVERKYIKGGKVKDDSPITIISETPDGFLGNARDVLAFTTPALGADNLVVEVLESPLLGKWVVKFPAHHNFAVKTQAIDEALYQSSIDNRYYLPEQLPERNDENVIAKYALEVKAERNARLSDTDDYVKMPDMTVEKAANTKRSALDDSEKLTLEEYRQALRDMTEDEGFPFVDYPPYPSALEYELSNKVASREQQKEMYL